MKVLKIENNHGLFLRHDDKYCNVTTISAQDVVYLLNCILDEELVEMDNPVIEGAGVPQPAEKIVYERMYQELIEVIEKKKTILEEVDSEYKESYEKYLGENHS